MLNSAQRITLLGINLVFGIFPCLAFFIWVERNASLPRVALEWGWPWIALQSWPIAALALWNFGLVLAFGVIHSLTAQPFFHRRIEKLLPPQAIRTVYLALTGMSLVVMMGLWQNTGIILWTAPLPPSLNVTFSSVLFWSGMALSGWMMKQFDALHFIGLKQLYTSRDQSLRSGGSPALITSGIYARVRHPIYTFTLLAFLLTPFMTLDRMIVVAASTLYLVLAIPYEERKLIALFGSSYEAYRKRVPALFPIISPLRRGSGGL